MFVHEAEAVSEQCTRAHDEKFRGLLRVTCQA
jgi:hypothetical protein